MLISAERPGMSVSWMREADSLNTQNGLNSYGLFVPIGVAFSKRLGKKSNTSLSLFFPIIDLGALTAYRTDATAKNLESLPDLNFANVLSPGAHLMLNLPKSPFFIGAGVQYGPNVREIDIDGSFEPVRAIRYMLSFGVDVPVIPFLETKYKGLSHNSFHTDRRSSL
jgi:hypothetical protein